MSLVLRIADSLGQRPGQGGNGGIDKLGRINGLLGAKTLQLNLQLGDFVLEIGDVTARALAALDGVVADTGHVGALAGAAGGEAQVTFGLAVPAAVAGLGDTVIGVGCANWRHFPLL